MQNSKHIHEENSRKFKVLLCPVCKENFNTIIWVPDPKMLESKCSGADVLLKLKFLDFDLNEDGPGKYDVQTCSHCYYSNFYDSFYTPSVSIVILQNQVGVRKSVVRNLFVSMPFLKKTRLLEQIVSGYVLSGFSYPSKTISGLWRQGLCFLRAYWVMKELVVKYPNVEPMHQFMNLLLNEAGEKWRRVFKYCTKQKYALYKRYPIGPDCLDFGYLGFVYLAGFFFRRFGIANDSKAYCERAEHLFSFVLQNIEKINNKKGSILIQNIQTLRENPQKECLDL